MNERLKLVRKNLNLTQEEFANILGIKRTSYASYETGRVIPSPPFIKLICNKYSISENWLVNGIGEMYITTQDNLLNQLKNKFNLSDLEYKILKSYLELDESQRSAVEDFIEQIIGPEPTITVAARGNPELKIIADDDAVRKDLENYKPPTDLQLYISKNGNSPLM